ncbi:MAG: hypothetical protein BLM47_05755 [Candidatus Reconcilbacillus cellulovorans]|uniref:Uncharacterized protein n=1 Tax=Candidatus Reconcilbacillus cellulovorans TaxID=1906605 RepID=A0A2A6E1A6_9BACL|nr:MAG: hypothetical protein BLM47_05755 [Candidatus Reconcilbacillus cellulovorans]
MVTALRAGWRSLGRQRFALTALFLHHLAWGWVSYRFWRSVVEPFWLRFPGGVSEEAERLFAAELMFRLLRSGEVASVLVAIVALTAVRFTLHSAIAAGIVHSLHRPDLNAGFRFVEGIRRWWAAFAAWDAVRLALSAAPAYWVWQEARDALVSAGEWRSAAAELAPWLAGWIVWTAALRLLTLYAQIGLAGGTGWRSGMAAALRNATAAVGIWAAIVACTGLVSLATLAVAFVWAGFGALIVYQAAHALHALLRLWGTAAHYRIWADRKR